jgi:hypothetical protein
MGTLAGHCALFCGCGFEARLGMDVFANRPRLEAPISDWRISVSGSSQSRLINNGDQSFAAFLIFMQKISNSHSCNELRLVVPRGAFVDKLQPRNLNSVSFKAKQFL